MTAASVTPGGTETPEGMDNSAANAPHDVPTMAELVEAVREFLEHDVLGSTTGRVQFHTRVAINVLRMVERQIERGADDANTHQEGLQALGFASERALADAIRAGELDNRYDEVVVFVRATVLAKLAVANPGYESEPEAR